MKRVPSVRSSIRFVVAIGAIYLLAVGSLAAAQEDAIREPSDPLEQSSAGNVVHAARMAYGQGMRELDRATKLAVKAEREESAEKSEKLLKKAAAARENAVQQFMQALRQQPELIEAYAALGQTFRSQGKHLEALDIHAIALRRDPESMENFQGWAESLMALNMLGNATASYADYLEAGSPRAEILMGEMKKWLAAKQADPGDLDPTHVQKMADWIAQQSQGG